jgi:hypothetical protein
MICKLYIKRRAKERQGCRKGILFERRITIEKEATRELPNGL